MSLDPQFDEVPEKLHEALLALSPTKSDCALHMINTGGLSIPQAQLERAIDYIIADLFEQLVLSASDYGTLLARHQIANPTVALREIRISWNVVMLKYEKQQLQDKIDDAISTYTSLTTAQKNAIATIKAVADEGTTYLNQQITIINNKLAAIEQRRNLGF